MTQADNEFHTRISQVEHGLQILRTDVKTLATAVESNTAEVKELAVATTAVAVRMGDFMANWRNAVPMRVVLIMFGLVALAFGGVEAGKVVKHVVEENIINAAPAEVIK